MDAKKVYRMTKLVVQQAVDQIAPTLYVKHMSNCIRVVVCINSFIEKNQRACSEVSFSLLEINVLLKFDFFIEI